MARSATACAPWQSVGAPGDDQRIEPSRRTSLGELQFWYPGSLGRGSTTREPASGRSRPGAVLRVPKDGALRVAGAARERRTARRLLPVRLSELVPPRSRRSAPRRAPGGLELSTPLRDLCDADGLPRRAGRASGQASGRRPSKPRLREFRNVAWHRVREPLGRRDPAGVAPARDLPRHRRLPREPRCSGRLPLPRDERLRRQPPK
jgi:hypothetical protein